VTVFNDFYGKNLLSFFFPGSILFSPVNRVDDVTNNFNELYIMDMNEPNNYSERVHIED